MLNSSSRNGSCARLRAVQDLAGWRSAALSLLIVVEDLDTVAVFVIYVEALTIHSPNPTT